MSHPNLWGGSFFGVINTATVNQSAHGPAGERNVTEARGNSVNRVKKKATPEFRDGSCLFYLRSSDPKYYWWVIVLVQVTDWIGVTDSFETV